MSSPVKTSPYKPSNLSYNSPRTSPFRRPESPFVTRSPSAISATTPFTTAPIEQPRTHKNTKSGSSEEDYDRATSINSPPSQPPPRYNQQQQQRPDSSSSSYFSEASSLKRSTRTNSDNNNVITPVAPLNTGNNRSSNSNSTSTSNSSNSISSRPLPTAPTPAPSTMTGPTTNPSLSSDPLSRLAPQHLLPMREAFSILDRSNTGTVTRADIADMLRQLGMDSSARSVDAFFQPINSNQGSNTNINKKDQGITLPAFLATLSALLPHPGTASELTAAFAAFDDTDAGQADWAELRDVLVKEEVASGGGGGGGGGGVSISEIDAVMDVFKGRRAFGSGGGGAGAGFGVGVGVGGGRGREEGRGGGTYGSADSPSSSTFRYHDFVAAVTGGSGTANGNGNGNGNSNGTSNSNSNSNSNNSAAARIRALA